MTEEWLRTKETMKNLALRTPEENVSDIKFLL